MFLRGITLAALSSCSLVKVVTKVLYLALNSWQVKTWMNVLRSFSYFQQIVMWVEQSTGLGREECILKWTVWCDE